MNWLEALILGILQGLTEFLPVSSSGHLELGKVLLNTNYEDDLAFTVLVHAATVLSIIIVFWKDIINIISNVLLFKWNEETQFFIKIIISMIPVVIVGLFWKKNIESLFGGQVLFVGSMLVITATILFLSNFANKDADKNVNYFKAIIIGLAQMVAILPGISRSGATIGTALLLGVEKSKATRFSFLMVLLPILGASIVQIKDLTEAKSQVSIDFFPLFLGFIGAFISGLFACRWMISIVKRGNLIYFAIYCLIIGLSAIVYKMVV
ncbi:undecaprenyl-diphosphate phosphatase [candidate division KSB1 bacterium]